MPCIHAGNAIVCSPTIVARRIVRGHCPNCNRRTFFAGWFQVWYGWHETCLKCGDRWQDGEALQRPFMPRWRQESIEGARKAWRDFRAAGGPANGADDAIRNALTEEFGGA